MEQNRRVMRAEYDSRWYALLQLTRLIIHVRAMIQHEDTRTYLRGEKNKDKGVNCMHSVREPNASLRRSFFFL